MKLFEQEFYDYGTAPVSGDQVVDLHKTGMSFYDDFLSNDVETIEYLKNNKNLVGNVVMMSPEEYYQECSAHGFPHRQPPVEKLKAERKQDEKIIQHLKDVLTVYKKRFPMPMLNKAQNGQEGLHRMLVIGELFGWNHKVPVLVVDWADKQRAFDEAKRERNEKIRYRIKRAVMDTLRYKFTNIEELKDQLQWELDEQFEYDEDVSTPVQFELTTDKSYKQFIVTIGAVSFEFDYDDVNFIDSEEFTDDDNFDADDIDLEEIEDVLKRYFGDNWRETNPHLKDVYNID